MTGRIEIGFAMAEGAVLRMLGLVERRGFEVRGISMAEREGQGLLSLDLNPRDAGRRLEVIAAQLRRLNDVRQVSFYDQGQSR
jgi:acetolactate synthase II small subunit